ncbi:MAG TPA: WGR domain-containing protein [Stellaceae bacterium]|nr:WGR domain-containing protein [Stellaceae bacterium]
MPPRQKPLMAAPLQLPLFPDRAALTRIRPERNEWRFYRLEVWPDLFGQALLARNWGRIGTGGRLRLDPFPTPAPPATPRTGLRAPSAAAATGIARHDRTPAGARRSRSADRKAHCGIAISHTLAGPARYGTARSCGAAGEGTGASSRLCPPACGSTRLRARGNTSPPASKRPSCAPRGWSIMPNGTAPVCG